MTTAKVLAGRIAASVAVMMATPALVMAETWDFEVRLDGKPIGTHRFVVDGEATARTVRSTARLDVKLLGLTVFRYRHEATERWRGDCLASVQSRTDDDGKPVEVDKTFDTAGALAPSAASAAESKPGAGDAGKACLMSYAYWNAALLQQQQLLNPQTGDVDGVRIERLPDGSIPVGGREVNAVRWRLTTTPPATAGKPAERQQLTLWRDAASGRWIGLDAVVRGGRVLTYRLP